MKMVQAPVGALPRPSVHMWASLGARARGPGELALVGPDCRYATIVRARRNWMAANLRCRMLGELIGIVAWRANSHKQQQGRVHLPIYLGGTTGRKQQD